MREAMWIQKTEIAINRNEGIYDLSHIYDDVIVISTEEKVTGLI